MSTKKPVFKWIDEQTEREYRLLVLDDGELVVENKMRGRWGRAYVEVGPTARLLVALVTGDQQLELHGRVSARATA